MIHIKDFLTAIDHKITGGSEYGWDCYGSNARYLDCLHSEGADGEYSVHAIFDSVTQQIYEIQAWDYVNDREYRWIDPDFVADHNAESTKRGIDIKESLDDRQYIDLDLVEDILEKISAIVAGEEYDSRVKVPVNFTDTELLTYMKMAHERDMTFNQFVEMVLKQAIGQQLKDELDDIWPDDDMREEYDFSDGVRGPAAMTAKKKKGKR